MPSISSPLNPSSSETPLRRERRAVRKYEPSPTQRLMRQKAAAARKLMSSRQSIAANITPTVRDNEKFDIKPATRNDDPFTVQAVNGIDSSATCEEEECEDIDLGVREVDTEKQALVENYRQDWRSAARTISETSIKRRLIVVVGVICIIGVFSVIRTVGRIPLWRRP